MLNPPRRFRLLDEIDDRGFLLAVATGKCRVGLARALARHGIADRFAASRCADEGLPKPHLDRLLALMDRLGAEPAETLMIGDTSTIWNSRVMRESAPWLLPMAPIHPRD